MLLQFFKKFLVVACLVFLASSSAFASLKMVIWNALPTAPLLIFVPEGVKPDTIARRYLEALRQDPEMQVAFGSNWPQLEPTNFREATSQEISQSSLLIANMTSDLSLSSKRIPNFRRLFEQSGMKTILLPLRVDLSLRSEEQDEMRQLIAEKIPLLVAMGGEDIEPILYNQENTYARSPRLHRDQAEAAILKAYIKAEKGFLFSVCRGHQLSSVTLGYELIQDIPELVKGAEQHSQHLHNINLKNTTYSRLLKLFPEGKIRVNSLHHQAVKFHLDGPLEVAAVGDDGIIEALEMKNGHGLFLQFHPELMEDHVGETIMSQLPIWKSQKVPRSCSRVH